ncbi:MAG: YjdF family protein [Oscillospiraceae bacterium]|jgi:hypothetical protein|nr:YjdF family protein [Oscillospiraceae bacterium]
MECDCCSVTVCFQDPFWVGLVERREAGGYSVCKCTFGGEPRDFEVYQFLLESWYRLRFSPTIPTEKREPEHRNPKRARREAARYLSGPPKGTKAQEALKLQRTEGKAARQESSRQERENEEERRFLLRQEKKKRKHRGR